MLGTIVSNTQDLLFDILVQNALPSSLIVSAGKRQGAITQTVSWIHSLYVNNDKGMYDNVEKITFFSAAVNDAINVRDLTRWVKLSPADNFEAVKLLSCMLVAADPDNIEFPPGIAYIQDIAITIGKSKDVNIQVPGANTGICSLIESTKLFNALTLADPNSWTNLAVITALLSYYRPPFLPTFTVFETQNIDINEKDFDLAVNKAISIIRGTATPVKVLQDIERGVDEIKYGGKHRHGEERD